MGGRHVNEFRAAASAPRLPGVEPLIIHWDRHDLRRKCFEHRRDDRETRILDADSITRIQQHADREIQGVLDARHDDDLISRALDAPRLPKIVGDRLPQWPVAATIAVRQKLPCRTAHASSGDLGPRRNGKLIGRRDRREGTRRLNA
jgi:hypothetical protein